MATLIAYAIVAIIIGFTMQWARRSLSRLPSYVGTLGRVWHVSFHVFCALVLMFLITPILVIMPLSFNSEPYFTYPMPGLSFRWYESFWSGEKSDVWQLAIKNSVVVAIFATLISTTLGTIAAVGLSSSKLPARGFLMGLLISPMIVPLVITAVGMYFFYTSIGLTPSQLEETASWLNLLPLIIAHAALGTPFVVITVTATLVGFDHSLTRAAKSLGANGFYTFRKITVPLVLPGMISGALFAFITSFDEIVVALFLARSEEYTIPRQMFSGIREQISPIILAVATILVLLSIALLISVEMLRRRGERLRGIRPD